MTRRRDWIAAYRERLQHRIDRAPEDVAYRILRARVPFEGTLVEDLAPVTLPPLRDDWSRRVETGRTEVSA